MPTTSEAAICLLRFPNGKIYVGSSSRVGDIDNFSGSYDELTAERIRRDHGGELPVPVKKILWRGANDGKVLKRKYEFIRQYRANDPDVGYNRMPMTRKNTPYKDQWVHDPVKHIMSTTHFPWGSYRMRCERQPDGLCDRRGDHQPWGDAPEDQMCKIRWANGYEEDLPGLGSRWQRYLDHKNATQAEWERRGS